MVVNFVISVVFIAAVGNQDSILFQYLVHIPTLADVRPMWLDDKIFCDTICDFVFIVFIAF